MSHSKRTYVLHRVYYKKVICGYIVTSVYDTKLTRQELALKLNSRPTLLEAYDKLCDHAIITEKLSVHKFNTLIHKLNTRYGDTCCSVYVTHGDKRYTKDEIIKIKSETDYTIKRRSNKHYKHPKTFRDLPIPYIHHSSSGSWYRQPKLGSQRKQNNMGCYDEQFEFNDTKYALKTLPTWDDRPRHYYKSWKDCTKRKHQYKEDAA